MRKVILALAVLAAGCGSNPGDGSDAALPTDSATDTGFDAPADASRDAGTDVPSDHFVDVVVPTDTGSDVGIDTGTDAGVDAGTDAAEDAADEIVDASPADVPQCPRVLLAGGTDVTTQGWSVIIQAPATLTYGADYVELSTSTAGGARSGGQLLLTLPGAVPPGAPFAIRVEMLVVAVSPHNPLDSAAAIMGSFTPSFGTTTERGELLYLDTGAIGWGNDSQSFTTPVTDGNYHAYELAVDASGNATVSVDGVAALSFTGYVTNGTIAVGDQTNEPNVDSTLRIRSITMRCEGP